MFGATCIARKNLDITLSLTPMHEVDVILEINIFFNEPLRDSRPNISHKFETENTSIRVSELHSFRFGRV